LGTMCGDDDDDDDDDDDESSNTHMTSRDNSVDPTYVSGLSNTCCLSVLDW